MIALGAILAALPYFMPNETEGIAGGWVADMVHDSPAHEGVQKVSHGDDHHVYLFGMPIHTAMYVISAVVGFIGIGFALYFHMF